MSRIVSPIALSVMLLAGGAAMAAERTVTLAVDGMSCVTCPYIVRTALQKVAGVARAEVSFAKRTAVVTFDDAKTTIAALTKATGDVGFPARAIGE